MEARRHDTGAHSGASDGRNRVLAYLSDFVRFRIQESSTDVNLVGAVPKGTDFGRESRELRMLGRFVLSCRDA